MTSSAIASALLRELQHELRASPSSAPDFAFARDWASAEPFADLSYDPAAPTSRYEDDARPSIDATLAAAAGTIARGAPGALSFVNAQMQSTLIRKTTALDYATSSSNRSHVGRCVLTNVHLAVDGELLAIEALVHESIHQYLYRHELAHGPLCDLDATQRFRSPWSGNRIPLHSFVHACFVYAGLVGVWTALAASETGSRLAPGLRELLARHLFGFVFVAPLLDGRTFPRERVDPAVLASLRSVATTLADVDLPASGTIDRALAACDDAAWPAHIANALQKVH